MGPAEGVEEARVMVLMLPPVAVATEMLTCVVGIREEQADGCRWIHSELVRSVRVPADSPGIVQELRVAPTHRRHPAPENSSRRASLSPRPFAPWCDRAYPGSRREAGGCPGQREGNCSVLSSARRV